MRKSQSDKHAELVEYVRSNDGEIPQTMAEDISTVVEASAKLKIPSDKAELGPNPFWQPTLILFYVGFIILMIMVVLASHN